MAADAEQDQLSKFLGPQEEPPAPEATETPAPEGIPEGEPLEAPQPSTADRTESAATTAELRAEMDRREIAHRDEIQEIRRMFEASQKAPQSPLEPAQATPEQEAQQLEEAIARTSAQFVQNYMSRFTPEQRQQWGQYIEKKIAEGDWVTPILEIATDVATRMNFNLARYIESQNTKAAEEHTKKAEEIAGKTWDTRNEARQVEELASNAIDAADTRLLELFPAIGDLARGMPEARRNRLYTNIAGIADEIAPQWTQGDSGKPYENRAQLLSSFHYHNMTAERDQFLNLLGDEVTAQFGLPPAAPAVPAPAVPANGAPAKPKARARGAGPSPTARAPVEEPTENATQKAGKALVGGGPSWVKK